MNAEAIGSATQPEAPAGAGEVPRPRVLEAGLVLLVVGVPLIFFPLSRAPFADPKLLVLLAACVLVAACGLRVDRMVFVLAAVWLLAVGVASALGADPWWSLMGSEDQGAGLILWAASGLLLVAGTGIPSSARRRIPGWLLATGVVVAAVAIVERAVPSRMLPPWLGDSASTLGQPVLVGGFLAAAIAAAPALPLRPRLVAGLVVLGSGLSVSGNRGGWIGAAIGLAISLVRLRTPAKRAAWLVAPLLVAALAWALADAATRPSAPVSAVRRFGEVAQGSARARLDVWSACLRSWRRHPVIGTGPGTAWGGFLRSATAEELRRAGRGWGDCHNILIESAVTTGALGALGLLALGGTALLRPGPRGPEAGWSLGAGAALLVPHLFQPLSVALTPLLFLAAGLSMASGRQGTRTVGLARSWLVATLAAGAILAGLRFVSSSAEQYGRTYDSPAALRASLRLEPLRLSSSQALARRLAIDGRAGDPQAADEARRLSSLAVSRHPWNPGVRLAAADVDAFLGDKLAAEGWLRSHLRLFPDDPVALLGAAVLALDRGDREAALGWARRSLQIQPTERARRIVDEAAGP